MRIGIDMMGGDFAPLEAVKGVLKAQKSLDQSITMVLIGDKEQVSSLIKSNGGNPEDFEMHHTTEVIGMGEHPTKAISQKKDSSIVVGFGMLAQGMLDAFISAGNTGAMLVGSMYTIKPIEGVIRPTITSILPKESGKFGILLDVGINADCKPDVLTQFGILGSLFCRHVYKIDNPKVGLLSIGEEKEKGNVVTQATHQLLAGTETINFIGNVEGRDLFNEKADVIICDGFTGNIVLKACESIFDAMKKRNIKDEYFDRWDYENYGGTPVLGVNAPVIIGHGISNSKAFENMIHLAKDVVESDLVSTIKSSFKNLVLPS